MTLIRRLYKMKRVWIIGILSLALLPMKVWAFGGCEEDCTKCHSLTAEESQKILGKLGAAEAKALEIRISPVKGLWEVVIEDKGQRGIMYVGFSKRHVIAGPIFDVDAGLNKTQESFEKMGEQPARYVDFSKIPPDPALVLGDTGARYKVAVFTDPDCPFCARAHEEMKKAVAERKDIAFFLKLMPLRLHPDAFWKSQSILCRSSLQWLEDNFEKKDIPKPDCDNGPEVEANIRLAQELGITGTPTLVFPDGLVITGVKDAKTLIELVTNPPKKGDAK
jgi:thiol:disulfide interchange protein DsbC